eukprot:TRINITY_DN24757_c0_g1_i1.p1 TRINITY_DN24757_c0_g1~~TRINITY_DN24757_c0_g1_i1.p1  ORF type:complete len:575 (+),score=157.03 TRINITY_DN24757_c0_g1_i1:39-1763(+)
MAMRPAVLAALAAGTFATDPTCTTGIAARDVCCAAHCGACGGAGCASRPGGSAECCTGSIEASGRSCATHGPPCVMGLAVVTVGHEAVFEVAREYVSFNLDTVRLSHVNYTDALVGLAAALTPAHLRVGGTQGDYMVYTGFGEENRSCAALPSPMTTHRCQELTVARWEDLLGFAEDIGATLVFGLSDMYGRPAKTKPEKLLCTAHHCPPFDASNMKELVSWTAAHRPTAPIYGWELGNELNTCLNGFAGAEAQARDLAGLRGVAPSAHKVIGPDTHSFTEFSPSGRAWLDRFIATAKAAGSVVDAYTFHMYSLGNGPALDPNNLDASFLSPASLDQSHIGGKNVVDLVRKHHGTGAGAREVWAGETAAANNGGQTGVTDTYIDGFWYLDQLGGLAVAGVSVFQRQELVCAGGYPLIEEATAANGSSVLTPLPDYYVALLHKRLMGTTVLKAVSSNADLRVYAHCAAAGPPGAVAFAVLNLRNASTEVRFAAEGAPPAAREEYILTAGAKAEPRYPNRLQSKQVLLNGKLLQTAGARPPAISGKAVPAGAAPLAMPPTSYGFVVLPDAKVAACM